MMHHQHLRVVIALRYKRTANVSTHLPLPSLQSPGKPRVGAAATNDGPGDPHGRMYNNHTPSLPTFWTRAATNAMKETLIWSGFQRVLIRCRRCSEQKDCLSSALGQVDAVRQGMVPRHAWCELDGSGMKGASHDASSPSEHRDGVAIQTNHATASPPLLVFRLPLYCRKECESGGHEQLPRRPAWAYV
jgi:hypothetical protein